MTSSDQQNGTPRFSGSNDFTKACGEACPPLSEKKILASRYFLVAKKQSRPLTAKFECFTLPFAPTGKISSLHSANSKSAQSNSNSRTTKSRSRFIFAIPTDISSRSRLTTQTIERADYFRNLGISKIEI